MSNKQYTGENSTMDCLSFDHSKLSKQQRTFLTGYRATEDTVIELEAVAGDQYVVIVIDGKRKTTFEPDISPVLITELYSVIDAEIPGDVPGKAVAAVAVLKHLYSKELLK